MLTKYWSLFLLLAMATTVLVDRRRNAYFRSPAPYVATAIFLMLTLPHLVWLIQNNFPPLNWVGARRSAHNATFWWRAFFSYTLGTVAYASAALILYCLGTQPSLAAIKDALWPRQPARRRVMWLFWIPLLAPVSIAFARGMQLVSLWNIPALNLLPVLLLSSNKVALPRYSVKVMAIVALCFSVGMIMVAPGVAYYKLRYGAESYSLYAGLAGNAAAAEWHATTSAPLRILAGPFAVVTTASIYMPDHPIAYSNFSRYLAPWIDQQRIDREGMAIVAPADDPHWVHKTRKVAGGTVKEVTLIRRWLWWSSAPQRFLIGIVPPKV